MIQKRTKVNESGLTANQKRALPFFVGCSTYDEGYTKAKISKTIFYAWLQNSLFKAELERLQDSVFDEALSALKQNSTKAAMVLAALLESQNEAIRRATANDILNHVIKYKELKEIEARLEALENIKH